MAIYRIPVSITGGGLPSPAINVWHCRVETLGDLEGGPTSPYNGPLGALQDFYTRTKQDYPGGMVIQVPNSIIDVDTQEETSDYTDLAPIIATGTNAAPRGLAVTVSWKTSVAARRARGRTFLGPLSYTMLQTDGTIADAFRSTLIVELQDLLNKSTAVNGWALGVYGQQTAGIPTPKVLRDFTAFSVADKFAHLRSRRD